jgi:hypothetical protein
LQNRIAHSEKRPHRRAAWRAQEGFLPQNREFEDWKSFVVYSDYFHIIAHVFNA